MSADFKTVLQKDPCIADITPDLVYAVKSGASATTYQPFPSTSATNSVIVFNIQVPSENIIVGRDALLQSPLQFTLNVSDVPLGQTAIVWGETASLQAYPIASCMTTATTTINNTTSSANLQDILPQILRLNSNRDLYRHNGMTPTLPDQNWGKYSDSFASNSSPLASYFNKSYDNDQSPRGAFPCYAQVDRFIGGVWQDRSPISTGVANETWRCTVFTVVAEPLFLSPFIYGDPWHNKQGILGINNMSFTLNINSTLNRLASAFVPTGALITISAGVLADPNGGKWNANPNLFANTYAPSQLSPPASGGPTILLKLLSSQPSDRLETRNVVPYFDLPRYLTNSANNPNLQPFQQQQLSSQSIQLSQLPDYFIIVARKPVTQQTITDTSSFLTIRNMSINLNNQSGLLSSCSAQDLWRMSVKNHSQQSWEEFSGSAFVNDLGLGVNGLVPTIGSMFVVSPSDLSLPDYLSSGSLGAFQLNFQATVYNQFNEVVPVELCVIACNSGIWVTQQGTCSAYTGILTREAVLSSKTHHSTQAEDRMIGGNMLSRSVARHPMESRRGGAMSGGAMSGGATLGMKSKLHGMY
jgi:hypothetical protein